MVDEENIPPQAHGWHSCDSGDSCERCSDDDDDAMHDQGSVVPCTFSPCTKSCCVGARAADVAGLARRLQCETEERQASKSDQKTH